MIRSTAMRAMCAAVAGVAFASAAISAADAAPRIALDPGEFTAEATAAIDLDKREAGRELSLSPDLWLGLPRAITLGAITSDRAVDRLDSGASICVERAPLVCDRSLHSAGLDARIAVRDWIAPRVRVLVRDVDPWKPAMTFGALVRGTRGRWTVWSDPFVRVGLANTERGNRAYVMLPVYAERRFGARLDLGIHTGVDGEVATWRDGYHVPLALAARVDLGGGVELGAEGGLRTLGGPQNSATYRTVMLSVAITRSPPP